VQSLTQLFARPNHAPATSGHRLVWAVSLGHLANDICMSTGPVTMTFLATYILKISPIQVGLAISLREFIGAVSQPFFGWLTDRSGGRIQAPSGVLWVALMTLCAIFLAMTGNFYLTLIPYALAAVGSGAFHPVGAMHASGLKQSGSARNTAYFFLAGQTGLAMGPLLAGLLLDNALRASGGEPAPMHMLPMLSLLVLVLPAVIFMGLSLPNRSTYANAQKATVGESVNVWQSLKAVGWGTLALLGVFIILRSIVHLGTANFLPFIFADKGWQPSEYGGITSLFWISSAVAGVIFGRLADRFDRRRVIAISLVLAAPLVVLLPLIDSKIALVVAMATGAMAGGAFPAVVVVAQSLLPGSKGFASGLILGAIFATGAGGSQVLGVLIDRIGFSGAFQVVGVIALIAAGVALLLPHRFSGKG